MRFIHDNLYPLLTALIFIIATSSWFAVPEPVAPAAITPPAADWVLPQQAQHESGKAVETINARNLFGATIAEAPEAPKAPEWHVRGIAMSGAERFVLLSYEGRFIATLKIGDTLPDGAKIVQITRNRFFVLTTDKKKLAYGIYPHEQIK